MNCSTEVIKSYDSPAIAGTYRFLLGLIMLTAGIYITTLSDFQGSGFGFLLILGSPFVILEDEK